MADPTFRSPSVYLRQVPYTPRESHGVIPLVVVSCISATAVFVLLITISISSFRFSKPAENYAFLRTHVAAYFVSLLICDLFQAAGSILNLRWIQDGVVQASTLCTLQGIFKQLADVGTAVWTLVIASHTFCILFLGMKTKTVVLWLTLLGGWAGILAVVAVGPTLLNNEQSGPFYGVSGLWCWINPRYKLERLILDYLFMFVSAFLCFVLYTLVFLRLRGNIVVTGVSIQFQRRQSDIPWIREKVANNQLLIISKQMLLYPVAYTVMILPIACARFSAFRGNDVPFEVTIFCGTVYLLSGLVNVILFTATRKVLPPLPFFKKRRRASTMNVLVSTSSSRTTDDRCSAGSETLSSKYPEKVIRVVSLYPYRPSGYRHQETDVGKKFGDDTRSEWTTSKVVDAYVRQSRITSGGSVYSDPFSHIYRPYGESSNDLEEDNNLDMESAYPESYISSGRTPSIFSEAHTFASYFNSTVPPLQVPRK